MATLTMLETVALPLVSVHKHKSRSQEHMGLVVLTHPKPEAFYCDKDPHCAKRKSCHNLNSKCLAASSDLNHLPWFAVRVMYVAIET